MRHRRTGLGLAIAALRSDRIDCDDRRCDGDWRLEMESRGEVTWTLRAWGLAIVSGPGASSQTR